MADYYDVFCYNGLIVLTPCIPPVPDSESALRPGVRVLGGSSASPPATSAPPKLRPFSETPAKPKKKLGWMPVITLDELVQEIVASDLTEAQKHALLKQNCDKVAVSI